MSKVSYPKLHRIVKVKTGLQADNIKFLPTASFTKIPVDDVLFGAHKQELNDVVIMGVDEWGNEYLAFSDPDVHRAHYLLHRAAQMLSDG